MPLGAAPTGTRITLLDLRPSFLKPGNQPLLRNGTRKKPGLFIAEKRYRGLNAPLPSRVGFDLELTFTRFSVKVGLLDGAHKSAQAVFRVLGDGKVLAATPPLFPGQAPFVMDHHQSREGGHAASLRQRSHRSRAALSAVSTVRLPIRLPVVR